METGEETPEEDDSYLETQTEQEVGFLAAEPINIKSSNSKLSSDVDRGPFIHGLAVGLGIGCIATFIIVWISVFFTPMLPSQVTYENLLSIFVYPLVYLLAVGLIALTAGIVREYYAIKNRG